MSADSRIKKNRRFRTVPSCRYATMGLGLICTVTGAVLPAMRADYGLSYAFAGMLSSVNMLTGLLGTLAISFLPYMVGEKKTSMVMELLMGAGLALVAVTGNPVMLILAYGTSGFGRGGTAIINTVVARNADDVSKQVNTCHAIGGIGCALCPFLAMLLGPEHWKLAVIFVSAWIISSVFVIFFSDMSGEKEEKPKGKGAFPTGRDFWLSVAILFCYLGAEACCMNFLIVYLMETGLFSPDAAMMMQTVQWTAIILGRFSCSFLSTRMRKSDMLLAMGLILTFFFMMLINASNSITAAIAVFGTGLGMSGVFPTGISSVDRKYAESPIATSTITMVGMMGAVILPVIVGKIADVNGMTAGYRAIVPVVAAMMVFALLKRLNEMRRRD